MYDLQTKYFVDNIINEPKYVCLCQVEWFKV